jgi:hypothetical protein
MARRSRRQRPFLLVLALVLSQLFDRPHLARAAGIRFGPPLNADPGAGEPFSIPHTEFDPEAGVECAYPPCRPLRHDLQLRQKHDQRLKRAQQKVDGGGLHEQPRELTEYPPKLNLVRGGGDCSVCNQVLVGERLNPSNLNHMRREMSSWLATSNSIIEAKPKDTFFKQHAIHVVECFHAFDRLTCTVEDPSDA